MDKDILIATIITVIVVIFSVICQLLKYALIIVGIFVGVWLICLLFGFDLIAYIGGII